jgi:hypothetical protein
VFQIKLEVFGYFAIIFGMFWAKSEFFLFKSGNYFSQIIEFEACKHYEMHTAHTLQSANNFFQKHIILISSKHKHLWENWTLGTSHSSTNDLQTHKLVPKYNKEKYKPMALHLEKKVENANTMERKFCDSQNNNSILQQYSICRN